MSVQQPILLLLIVTTGPTMLGSDPLAAETKYFRSDAGVARSAGPLPENFAAPEALVWRVPLEAGHSTPILHGGKIFLTTYRAESKQLATIALDEGTGR